ncbi:hypothetical protein OAB57_01430 [Bacteriovoracaceae bacterium]|nr:hypothetical protein [Bacteriovoracaceae bacterium]
MKIISPAESHVMSFHEKFGKKNVGTSTRELRNMEPAFAFARSLKVEKKELKPRSDGLTDLLKETKQKKNMTVFIEKLEKYRAGLCLDN